MTMVMTMKALGGVLFSGSYTFLLAARHALLDSYLINLSFMQNFILYHMFLQITDNHSSQRKENQCIQQFFYFIIVIKVIRMRSLKIYQLICL